MFELIKLPYERDALEPFMSGETLDYHYGKHHKTYVDKLNALIVGTEFENLSLEQIVIQSKSGPIFNNAAQVWNHNIFLTLLKKNNGVGPQSKLLEFIERDFGSFDAFKEAFTQAGISFFGSGWVWLVQDVEGKLSIVSTVNAATPLVDGKNVLLAFDVWEHSYYIDYRNNRAKYLENFWQIVNWEEVEKRVL